MRERAVVFDVLARAGLGVARTAHAPEIVGPLSLHPHQVEAVQRLRPLLAMHHGALLADAVGLGKTYVALAIASDYASVDVIAPAGLVGMWRAAIARARLEPGPGVRSLHAFSSPRAVTRSDRSQPRLVIIDEAHHLRNPATRRYRAVAEWCRQSYVLLLSATPVHNIGQDLTHLLALFLGVRAHALDDTQRTALIVRRNAHDLFGTPGVPRHLPALVSHEPLHIGDSAAVTRALSSIPPPLPTRDGRAAAALVTLGLIRAWCSSGAACLAMIGRRRSRAQALADILESGRWPSRHELRAWTITEDTVQLGFTELLVESREDRDHGVELQPARAQLALHSDALAALAHQVRAVATPLDRTRVDAIRKVRALHRGVAVIAFSQFADTIRGIARLMQWDSGVATLTSHGGRVAGGTMSREELLRRTAPRAHGVAPPAAHERIYLVLTTDLLAEGVNLQDAGVVVHLDLPWTPAAIAQREGRIARLGSLHERVHSYALAAPGGGADLMRLAARLRRKARAASIALAPERSPERSPEKPSAVVSLPTASSLLHQTLRRWLVHDAVEVGGEGNVSLHMLRHHRQGWLAAVGDPTTEAYTLWGGWFTQAGSRTRATGDLRTITRLVQAAHAAPDDDVVSRVASARYQRLVERAVLRRARLTQAQATVEPIASPHHRAQRHARRLLAAASLTDRVRLAPRAELALRTVRALRGAGDEIALDKLLHSPAESLNADDWFSAVVALGGASDAFRSGAPRATAQPAPRVLALLLLL